MSKVQVPTIGRDVHYALSTPSGVFARPAKVVNVFTTSPDAMPLINLQVLTDGRNDEARDLTGADPFKCESLLWRTSVHYDASGAPGTWRWPPHSTATVEIPDAAPAA